MVKTRVILIILLAPLFFSCGRSHSVLKDGYYNAESSGFDYSGWKEYLTICVSGGKIILVEYNAYNSSGFVKSWDMECMRNMIAYIGTYPSEYYRYYARQLLRNQNIDSIDVLTGATFSYWGFLELAKAVLDNAREGNSKTALVNVGYFR